ncbi:polyprenyl synthetase [Streptomyces sp. TRM 70351]|uniref:polyprenyl synthetase n=1 Tax=Streptomyces sp. TRM 70351 TaxID=3116552 RepID=UPI002E7BAA4D|nr:polyprenyl synthetase [Streptomyces sp. TRM 70351]MEE1929894.1 polyprenyl synthetase [Streptomyces sp. TRM 70351]
MTERHDRGSGPRKDDAVLLVAGVADLAVSGLSAALGGLRGLLGRADLADLAGEGRQDVRARGRLALDRLNAFAPAHLEVLAQHAAARRDDRAGG